MDELEAELSDQAALLGEGDEDLRADVLVRRAFPASQSFEAGDRPRAEIEDRLVVLEQIVTITKRQVKGAGTSCVRPQEYHV